MQFNQNGSQLRGLLKEGFERSTNWAHTATALFVFATDFLKQLIPNGMGWLAGGALALPMFVWLAVYFRKLSRELGWSIIVFCLITASLAIGMLGLQYALGEKGEKDGALVALVPGLKGLQEQLSNIAKDVAGVRKTTERTETKVEGVGKTTERTETKVDAYSAEFRREFKTVLAQVAREKGVEVAPLRAVLDKLGEKGVADENIPKKLNDAADELIKLRTKNDLLKKGPPQIAAIATEAQSLIDKGEFDAARAVLARGWQAWKESGQNSSRYEAQLLAQEAGIDHLQLAYRSAAYKYGEYGEGERGTEELTEAVAAYREALKESTRERVPLGWAMTQMDLGNALGMLGERESGTGTLTEAVAAYREALKEYTRERVPLDWARTQVNLGNALGTLGERESGTGKLTEAVAAYREALKEYTRERDPLEWAGTQMSLGTALETLGERERGTGKLEEAVAAYREALNEQTRERVPLNWARTQVSLGTALARLGERESGTGTLTEAVAAYREALKEYTPQTDPTNYQLTMKNLNQVLTLLKKRSGKKGAVH